MLDGIVMNVIYMAFEIPVVANLMLPKSPLPKINLPSLDARMATRCFDIRKISALTTDARLDQAPALAIIHIILRQCPDCM